MSPDPLSLREGLARETMDRRVCSAALLETLDIPTAASLQETALSTGPSGQSVRSRPESRCLSVCPARMRGPMTWPTDQIAAVHLRTSNTSAHWGVLHFSAFHLANEL